MKNVRKKTKKTTNETKWNVMVYLAGDNNLSEEMVYALKEMQRIGTTDGFRRVAQVRAQFDPKGARPRLYDFSGSVQPQVKPQQSAYAPTISEADGVLDSFSEEITAVRIPSAQRDSFARAIENVENSADPIVLEEFVRSNIAEDGYNMLVLSGHGAGALGDFLPDIDPSSSLSIPKLRTVLDSIRKKLGREIDILGMDSCVMSMVEVCYELRNSVRFLVGAEGFELNTGWPYHRILEALRANPGIEPEQLAPTIVKKYTDYYKDYAVADVSVDHAACDLNQSKTERLVEAVASLREVLQAGLYDRDVHNAILLAHWRAQSYKGEEYVDLWDFCDLLQQGCSDGNVQSACDQVKTSIENDKNGFVLKSCYSGAAFQHSHGLSIYFPWNEYSEEYENLEFHKATGWGDFLKDYVRETRRKEREGKGELQHITPRADTLISVPGGVRIDPEGDPRALFIKAGNMKNPPKAFRSIDC